MAGPSSTPAFFMPQIAVQDSQAAAPKIDWKEPHGVQTFTFKELAKATNNFAPDRKIGEGVFGSVYMGWLSDGREVAIKRMRQDASSQGIREFLAEVTILHSVSHKHIVRLFGYCDLQEKRQLLPKFWKKNEKQEYLLVHEFTENRSLDFHLHDQSSPVTASWKMRMEILLGVSRAIEYLQSYAEQPVIHRDVKPSNILLDSSWAPRLTDFGLALSWKGEDHTVDAVCGTFGYMAPEYLLRGAVNPTTDVYSFGVVVLEVLTGKTSKYLLEEEWQKEREAYEEEKKREVRELEEEREEWEKEQQKLRDEWKEKEGREEFEEEEQQGDEWKEKERDECEEEWDEDTAEVAERAKQDHFAHHGLVKLAVPLIEAGELWKVLDRRPAEKPTPRQLEAAELVAQVAVRCVRLQWEARPSISEVVATLETGLELARHDG